MTDVLTNAPKWAFKVRHVEPLQDIYDETGTLQNFISAESIVLGAGPASWANTSLDSLELIGLCDSVSVQQTKNVQQLFEVGSRIPYMLPGRTYVQFQLTRVVFNGDSLLGALTRGSLGTTSGDNAAGSNGGRFYLNLASSFFNSPFGLAILIQDSNTIDPATGGTATYDSGAGNWVAGFYAENCLIQTHQMGIQGQQYIVMETALVRTTNLVPIPVS
jgi:hypothetical protein